MNDRPVVRKRYVYYTALLLLVSIVALALSYRSIGIDVPTSAWQLLFLLLFCLFTIAVGYPHPAFGHVSFDRVGQIVGIVLFGPIIAAIIAGLSSCLYPFYRLTKGVPLADVIIASVHNCGLMILVVLGGGLFYKWTGGAIPLDQLTFQHSLELVGLLLVMQIINEFGMWVYMEVRSGDGRQIINKFNTAVEISAGSIGVLVAIIYTRMEAGVILLSLAILTLGMFALRHFAVLRIQLETIVQERTAELQKKTEELQKKTEELELKATHDKLTGLYNRRYADEYLEREIASAIRYQEHFTVALADIDHFKSVNDSYSHETGDRVLQEVAKLLASNSRSTDTIARYGGEEFLFCFPRSNANDAFSVCEKLRKAVEEHQWSEIDSKLAITLSFGIAQIDVNSRRKSILREADERLYAAKNLGRNRVVA